MRYIEKHGIVRTVYLHNFRHIQGHSATLSNVQAQWETLRHIQALFSHIQPYKARHGVTRKRNTKRLKVTSAKKRWLLLRHRLMIFLFHKEIMFCFQDIQVFIFLTIPWLTKPVTLWWVLVHKTGCIFEHIFWTIPH